MTLQRRFLLSLPSFLFLGSSLSQIMSNLPRPHSLALPQTSVATSTSTSTSTNQPRNPSPTKIRKRKRPRPSSTLPTGDLSRALDEGDDVSETELVAPDRQSDDDDDVGGAGGPGRGGRGGGGRGGGGRDGGFAARVKRRRGETLCVSLVC